MKRISIIVTGIVASMMLGSCDKESTKDVSRVTNYPILELQGDQFMTIPVGTAFNDPGVTATIGEDQVTPEITGSVDINSTGVYVIRYSAKNKEGFAASIRRWVGVIDAAAAANDFSGQYQRTAYGTNTTPAGISNWEKVMDGLYTNDDIGGVGAATIDQTPGFGHTYYIFNVEGNDIIFPSQPNPLGGEVFAVSASGDERIEFTPGPVGTDSYIWSVRGAGYGTPPRTFTKQ